MLTRRPLIYLVLTGITVLLGLLSRSQQTFLQEWSHLYMGDVLWALMVYWLLCFLFLKGSICRITGYSLCFCYSIELSQLYQAEWINFVRSTRLGGLVLGYGFLWSDLLAYSVGIGLGASIEWGYSRLRRH